MEESKTSWTIELLGHNLWLGETSKEGQAYGFVSWGPNVYKFPTQRDAQWHADNFLPISMEGLYKLTEHEEVPPPRSVK